MSPFRDLFIELPRALFETLQGIGAEAIRAEQRRQHMPAARRPTMRDALRSSTVIAGLCERYGWDGVEVFRLADRQAARLWVRWSCRHRQPFDIADELLERDGRAGIGALLDDLDRQHDAGRRCFCVRSEQTRGDL